MSKADFSRGSDDINQQCLLYDETVYFLFFISYLKWIMQLHIPKIGLSITHHLSQRRTLFNSKTMNHCLHSPTAAKRFPSIDPRLIPAHLCYVTVPVFSIGCSVGWTCNTNLLKLWNRPFCWVSLPQHVCLFRWSGFCCRFWYKVWAPSHRRWVCPLPISSSSRSSSSAADSCAGCHIFPKFLWHQPPIKSIYGKINLFYSLFFFRNCVFPIVSAVLTYDRSLLGDLILCILTEWFAKSKNSGEMVISFFKLVEEGRGGERSFVVRGGAVELWEVGVGQSGVDQSIALTFVLLLSIHLINDNRRNHFIYHDT